MRQAQLAPNSERYLAGRNDGLKTFCTYERGYAEGSAGRAYGAGCPQSSKEIGRIKTALKEGIPNPRTRSQEIERLEALTRESEQLESRIEQMR